MLTLYCCQQCSGACGLIASYRGLATLESKCKRQAKQAVIPKAHSHSAGPLSECCGQDNVRCYSIDASGVAILAVLLLHTGG